MRGALACAALLAFGLGLACSQQQIWPATEYIAAYKAWKAQQVRRQMLDERMQDTQRNSEELAASGRVIQAGQASPHPGYTFVCKDDYSPMLVNMEGRPVYQWQMPFSRAWPGPSHVRQPVPDAAVYCVSAHLYPDGGVVMVLQGLGDTPYGYGLVKMDKDSHLIWKYGQAAHHDVHVAPDGRIYTLTQAFQSQPLPGLEFYEYPILADSVAILSADGQEEQRIPILEAFLGTPYQAQLRTAYEERFRQRVRRFDVSHANSVMPLPARLADRFPLFRPGQVLLSLKNMGMLAVLDPETRKIVWALRGPWSGQHQARFLDNGNIMLFDNEGLAAQPRRSRLIEIAPDTGEVVWQYDGSDGQGFYTQDKGGYELLPGGDLLLTVTGEGRVSEITRDGKEIWRFALALPIPAAQRYPAGYFTMEFCGAIGCQQGEGQ